MTELADFRRHARAGFAGSDLKQPGWLLQMQDRAARQIKSVGLASKLQHIVSGYPTETAKREQPLEVFVIGEGNFGKSTLINALMGSYVAPVDFLPKTWCFNRYIVTLKARPEASLFIDPVEPLEEYLRTELGEAAGVFRRLDVYELPADVAERVIQREEEHWNQSNHAYRSPIMEIQWEVASSRAQFPNLRLVDTNGLNQRHADREHVHYLKWQYERADAVLWIITQDRIGSAESDNELREASRYAKPVILMLNKWDKIHGDGERQLERARQLYGRRVSAIVPFSAQDAFLSLEPENYSYTEKDRRYLASRKMSSWSELYPCSGLIHLGQVFDDLVGRKATQVHNMQVYSATRQKQREYRSVFSQQDKQNRANVNRHRQVCSDIQKTQAESQALVKQRLLTFDDETRSLIERGLPLVTYAKRQSANHLLELDRISVSAKELHRVLCRECTERLTKIVSRAQKVDMGYEDNEYLPSGVLAVTNFMSAIGEVSIIIAPPAVSWQMDIPSDLFSTMKAWIASLFGQPQWMAEEDRMVRELLRQSTGEAIRQFVIFSGPGLADAIDDAAARLNQAALDKMEALGGQQQLIAQCIEIENSLSEVAIPAIFLHMLVKAMLALRWPQLGSNDEQ